MDSLDPLANLEKDAKSIFNNLDNVVLSMERKYTLKGEVNTKYGDRSVYGNFERILGQYNWQESDKSYSTEIKKENTYAFKYNENTYPLHIEVYPYREGSKVVYSLYLRYDVSSDGTSTLSKEDIEAIKTKLSSIVND